MGPRCLFLHRQFQNPPASIAPMRTPFMPSLQRSSAWVVSFVVSAVFLFSAFPAVAQVAPPLGTAERFSVLGNSGVTGSTGAGTAVNGDVGSSPTPAISNFPPSTVLPPFVLHTTNDTVVQQARIDSIAAYNFLVAQGPGTVLPAQLNGAVLTSGIYSFAGGAADLAATGTLTLNGPGIFIFQVDSALTANVGSNIVGTADPCNIYWRVGTSATLNGDTFRGTVIAGASITVGDGSDVAGRLLAGTGATGAVTMAGAGGNTIGGCAVPTGAPCPTITLNPATLPNGTAGTAYSTTVSATGGTAPYTFALTAGTLPAGLTLNPVTGQISGTPTTAGTSNFTVTATDALGCVGSRAYQIVAGAPGPTVAVGVPTLDFLGLAVLFVLLASAGLFVMSRF